MTLDALAIIASALVAAADASTAVAPGGAGAVPDADALEREPADAFRTPVDALAERMIGSASRSVRFDWRRSPFGIAALGSELLERNNFGSSRLGALGRRAFGDAVGEIAVTYVTTWETESSELLSLTPYRQAARPNRFELDVNASYAVAEGVVTPLPNLLPPAEMVFLGTAGVRYLVYPEAFAGMSLQDAALALASPGLSQQELDNLEGSRLPGMQIDTGRFGLLAGVSLDLYFQPGVFVSPRALLNLPVLSVATGSRLGLWWETSLAVGFAL